MIETRVEVVYRRLRMPGEVATRELKLIWQTVLVDGLPVRRTLIDASTGEILDDVLVEADGRLRAWSVERSEPPNRRGP